MRPENRSGTSAIPGGRAPAAARAAAAQVVEAVWRGRSLDVALPNTFSTLPAGLAREHALIQEMAYGALRWHFQLLPLVRDFIEKPFQDKDADVEALLVVGFYQLLHMRVAAHAAVKETVEAAAVLKKDWAKPMLNAVLRRALREENQIRARIAADETLEFAHPVWMLDHLKQAWPDDWRAMAQANNARPPLTLRVNGGKTTRAAYLEKLQLAGLAAQAVPEVDSALVLEAPLPVEALPGFRTGEVSVQDAAAQLSAVLLDTQPGERVLDACAAPGGKAAHILERTPQAVLTALDISAPRLERVRENFARLGLTGTVVQGDAARPADWWDGRPYERILLDAPCSATGVIRRHPDIRLHRTPADIEQLAAGQTRLLNALWPLLGAGGKLLYVTCSIFPQENTQVLARFLAGRPDARVVPLAHPALGAGTRRDNQGVQILPGAGGMDGFYYAGLVKTPVGA
jgi:16S rRNA (cytosine967-C5)-methyltransferase